MPQDDIPPEIILEDAAPVAQDKRNFLPWILLATFFAAIIIYSFFWYFMAGRMADNLAGFIAQASRQGVDIRCEYLQKNGFPLRLGLSCASLTVQSAEEISTSSQFEKSPAFAYKGGFIIAGAPVYAPHWVRLEMGAPARLKLHAFPMIEADWQKLQAEGDFTTRYPHNIALAAERPFIRNLPFVDQNKVFSADFIRFIGQQQEDHKFALTFSFDDLSLPYRLNEGSFPLPKLNGSLDIAVNNSDHFYAAVSRLVQNHDPAALRGQSGTIHKAILSFEDGGGFTLSGPFSVAEDGNLSGTFSVTINNAQALLRFMRSAEPSWSDNLDSLFFVLNSMPKNEQGEPQLNLSIINGHVRIGFLRLGKIPPL